MASSLFAGLFGKPAQQSEPTSALFSSANKFKQERPALSVTYDNAVSDAAAEQHGGQQPKQKGSGKRDVPQHESLSSELKAPKTQGKKRVRGEGKEQQEPQAPAQGGKVGKKGRQGGGDAGGAGTTAAGRAGKQAAAAAVQPSSSGLHVKHAKQQPAAHANGGSTEDPGEEARHSKKQKKAAAAAGALPAASNGLKAAEAPAPVAAGGKKRHRNESEAGSDVDAAAFAGKAKHPERKAAKAAKAAAVAAAAAAAAAVAAGDADDDELEEAAEEEGEADEAPASEQQREKDEEEEEEDGKVAAAAAPPKKLTPEEEAEKLRRTVFVGNVAAATRRKQLKAAFKQFGEVESVRLRSMPLQMDSKLPRRHAINAGKLDAERAPATAYVVFAHEAGAKAAVAANMAVELLGHHLRIDFAAPARKATASGKGGEAGSQAAATGEAGQAAMEASGAGSYDPMRSVFVGNLHFQAQDEELITFFLEHAKHIPELAGAVEAVRLVRDRHNSVGKGFAFVMFKTKAAARAALALNGKPLRKRELRITRVARPTAGGGHMASRPGGLGSRGGHAATAGRPGNPGPRGSALPPADWQGVRTKGTKGLRGAKLQPGANAAKGGSGAKGGKATKRPAVAARKAAAKGGAAGSPAGAAAAPFKKKKGGSRKPWDMQPSKKQRK